jgi:predicted DNA-binding transcriptional regulator AlpA
MTLAVLDLDLLAEKIAARTSRVPISLKYLTVDDLADMLAMHAQTIREDIVTKPGFPAPIEPLGRKSRRWNALAVKVWLERQCSA